MSRKQHEKRANEEEEEGKKPSEEHSFRKETVATAATP